LSINFYILEIAVYLLFLKKESCIINSTSIMKYLSFLFIIVISISLSCKEKSKEIAKDESSQSGQQEWLYFEGESSKPHIVFVSGDEEYRSEEALPALAKIMNQHHGFNCTVLFAQDPAAPGIINPNYGENIPGLEHLASADLMVNFTRFRALPDDQMQHFDNYLKSGKPVIGIRTATHAFHFKKPAPNSKWAYYGNYSEGEDKWTGGFGRLVLGEKWISHHGHHRHQSTRGIIEGDAGSHPILTGITSGDIWCPTDVYGVRLPLPGDSKVLVLGQVINREADYDEEDLLYGMRDTDTEVATENEKNKDVVNPNDPMMPVAWTKSYQIPGGKEGKVFASTIGASTDLLNDATRRMFVNAMHWLTDQSIPSNANIDFIGIYKPTAFSFVDDDYWVTRNTTVASMDLKKKGAVD